MGEPIHEGPKGPGVPGFAASFATSSRQRGDRDTPGLLGRLLTTGLVVVVLGAGVMGVGKLIDYQRDKSRAAQAQAAERVALSEPSRPSPAPSGTGKPREIPQLPSGQGPIRYLAPPALQPLAPSSPSPTGKPSDKPSKAPADKKPSQKPSEKPATPPVTSQQLASGQKSFSLQASQPSHRIVGAASNRCVDVKDAIYTAAPATALQLFACGNNPNQQWTVYSDGTIRSLGMCMSVGGGSTTDGASVDLYTCDGSASQKWRVEAAGDIANVKANKCLDARDFGTADRTALQIYTCEGTNNQKWHFG
ncbi:RICIN domain-containing protein [Streptomyces liangshanensis]|uniref:RICIN domain-containing protein n=1 Tax=Streptomyces liangshanensis TaxID=2717324 RepID=UPI0036DA2316